MPLGGVQWLTPYEVCKRRYSMEPSNSRKSITPAANFFAIYFQFFLNSVNNYEIMKNFVFNLLKYYFKNYAQQKVDLLSK